MSRKMYWLLNTAWQVVMYGSLQCFYQYESYTFNYHYHYKAYDIWLASCVMALLYALMYYALIESAGAFPKRK